MSVGKAPQEKDIKISYDIVPASEAGILRYLNDRGALATDFSLASLIRCPSALHPAPNGKNAAYMIWQNGPGFFFGWYQVHDAMTGVVWFTTKDTKAWTAEDRAWVSLKFREKQRVSEKYHQEALQSLTAFYVQLREGGASHPYLQKKCVRWHSSFRLYAGGPSASFPWLDKSLIVPYFALNGSLVTLQSIPWEEDGWHKKYLYPGAPKTAASLLFQPERTGIIKKTVGIAEGFATADSFARAMDFPCFAAIDGGNMSAVAAALRASPKYKDYHIIIAADNDIENPQNPGLGYALKAASSAKTESIAVPVLGELSVDFNDLYIRGGDDLVRSHALFPKAPEEVKSRLGVRKGGERESAPDEQPRFRNFDEPPAFPSGLYSVSYTKQGTIAAAERIGSRLDILGLTCSEEGEFGRLVEYVDERGRMVKKIVPESALNQPGSAATLQHLPGYGTVRAYQKRIPEYINDTPFSKEYTILTGTGWRRDGDTRFFILPGETLEKGGKTFMCETSAESDVFFTRRGTLKGWQDTVCALSSGNPHLILALTEALAAPLRGYLGEKMFAGWNVVGDHQIGKTLCLQAGASCYGRGTVKEIEDVGHPEGAVMKWSATKNGVERICRDNNHLCLFLDELGEMAIENPTDFSAAIYMIMNGEGKRRMDKDTNARPVLFWRASVFTASEASISSYLTAKGLRVYSGQESRIYDIPAQETGTGLFENLHGHKTLSEFGKALGDAVKENYGHALPAFLGFLAEYGVPAALYQKYLSRDAILDFFQLAQGVPHDQILMATKLAVNRLALHLGIAAGIFPWSQEDEEAALRRVFYFWLDQFDDKGKLLRSEVRKTVEHWEAFLLKNLGLFLSNSDGVPKKDAVGIYRNSHGVDEYCVFSSVFKGNCLDPRQYKRELKVLEDAGMFLPSTQKGRGLTTRVKLPGEKKDSANCFCLRLPRATEDLSLSPDSFPEPDENMDDLPF